MKVFYFVPKLSVGTQVGLAMMGVMNCVIPV